MSDVGGVVESNTSGTSVLRAGEMENVEFWNYDSHAVFHTAELTTNSLGDFVVFWN